MSGGFRFEDEGQSGGALADDLDALLARCADDVRLPDAT
jgi:hypothetical protein